MGGTHHTGSTTELLHTQPDCNSELHVFSYHPVSLFNRKFLKLHLQNYCTAWTQPDHFGLHLELYTGKKGDFQNLHISPARRDPHAILHWHQDFLQIWHPPSAVRMLSKAEVGRNGTFMKSPAMLLCDKGGNGCGKISIFALKDRVSSSEGFKKSWSW